MAATAQSQYRHQERRTVGRPVHTAGQPAQTINWDHHLEGLLTDLKQSLPAGRAPVSSPGPLSADLSVPDGLPGAEDFHERNEYTSPDRRVHTVEERSRRTERLGGGSQVVSRQVVRSQSRGRTAERTAVTPEPLLSLVDSGLGKTDSVDGFIERNGGTSLSNTPANLQGFNSRSPPADLSGMEVPTVPVPGTRSHVSRYEYHSSQRSVSPAAPLRQPAPTTLSRPPAPASLTLQEVTTDRPPPPPTATTINYHIYNYGTEAVPPTDSGRGTLERGGGPRCQGDSLERRTVREGSTTGLQVPPVQPGPLSAGETVYSRSVTMETESAAARHASDRGGGGGGMHPVVTGQRSSGGGTAPFPVDTVERTVTDTATQSSVHVPSQPQDGTYPDGPRRRDLGSGQASEVRSVPLVTEPSETASDLGLTQSQRLSHCTAPGVYYPPPGQMNCETKFHSKEKGKKGNTKTYFEASGKYKASGGSKEKEAKDGKTIPICLPCCAGAACAIM